MEKARLGSRLRKVLLTLCLVLGLVLICTLLNCAPFRPVVLLRTSTLRDVPEVNTAAFRRELDLILSDYGEPHITFGSWVLVRRGLARDGEIASKYTRMALAQSGQEALFFAEDEEVMTSERMRGLLEESMELDRKEQEKMEAGKQKAD